MTPVKPSLGMSPGPLLLLILGVVVLAACATFVGVTLAGLSKRFLVVAVALAGFGIIGLVIRDVQAALVFLLPLAGAYNRHFYSFDSSFGDWGYAGLYWVPMDGLFFLLCLVILWGSLMGQPGHARRCRSGAIWGLLLLVLTMALSVIAASHPVPAIFEVIRFLKLLCMVLILTSIMTPNIATALLLGIAVTVGLQSAIGALQFGLNAGGAGLSDLSRQSGEMAGRATGTLGHPNFLAPYLLTIVPGFIAVALGLRTGIVRIGAASVAILGTLAIVMSQSRMCIAALGLALAGILLHLVLRRILSPIRVVGLGLAAVLTLTFAMLPVADRIYDRLTGDFGESVSFRADYNAAAYAMWSQNPLLGVGPNQFVAELGAYSPELKYINDQLEKYRLEANARTAAPVHNVYLLILSELGAVGLAAFAIFLTLMARDFWRAGAGSLERPAALFFLGIFWGLLGLLIQQLTDFSLWWDHHMNLLILLIALAAYVRSLPAAGTTIATASR